MSSSNQSIAHVYPSHSWHGIFSCAAISSIATKHAVTMWAESDSAGCGRERLLLFRLRLAESEDRNRGIHVRVSNDAGTYQQNNIFVRGEGRGELMHHSDIINKCSHICRIEVWTIKILRRRNYRKFILCDSKLCGRCG